MQNEFIFDPISEITNYASINSDKIHIRIKQRNGRQSYTIIENLPKEIELLSLAKKMRQKISCNAFVKSDNIIGKYIQLFGDQRIAVKKILLESNISSDANIVIHGY